ncbi:hypothetical protein C8Q77DRAFT_816347 [Trametes polyzona]|nr:hypothetical protein C8Q77DRAFT_816347 [Trametes polyzona]
MRLQLPGRRSTWRSRGKLEFTPPDGCKVHSRRRPSIRVPVDHDHHARPSGLAGCLSSNQKREEAWKFCAATLEHHYDERLKRWNAELDTLLVFAGLFSAALTAFNVQSYLLLQPDNTDTIVLALVHISAQLESQTANASSVNSVRTAFAPPDPTLFAAPSYAVWMNMLWFSSLACTLSAGSIAVVVKQWLYQSGQGLSGSSSDMARLRQYRYDSLLKWRVPGILAALPLLLQVALALFFAGLLILLYSLHTSVAVVVSVLVGGVLLFTAATTLLPVYYPDCCYQSPQALSMCISAQALTKLAVQLLNAFERSSESGLYDTGSLRYAIRSALRRLEDVPYFRSWQAREKPDVEARHDDLEQAVALTTYTIISDTAVLTSTVVPCLSGMNALSERMSVQYGELLMGIVARLKRASWAAWRPAMPFVLVVLSLIVKEPRPGAITKVLSTMPVNRLTAARSNLGLLFVLAMANLASRGIAAREAFEHMLCYLRQTEIGRETSITFGRAVLTEVEAAFPTKVGRLEELVNLDKSTAISHYLTGIECVVLYLLRHRTSMSEPLLPFEQRVVTMLNGFRCFLVCPAWRQSPSRQENVLWALRGSSLPAIIRTLQRSENLHSIVQEEVSLCITALQQAVDCLSHGCASRERGGTSSQTVRQALKTLTELVEVCKKEYTLQRKTPGVPDTVAAIGDPSPGDPVGEPSSGVSILPLDPTETASALSIPEEAEDDCEMDVVDVSHILDSGVYWDEIPATPGVDASHLSALARLQPDTRGEDDESQADPVLPPPFEPRCTDPSFSRLCVRESCNGKDVGIKSVERIDERASSLRGSPDSALRAPLH